MRRFVEGVDRGQSTLFPECHWIYEDNGASPEKLAKLASELQRLQLPTPSSPET